MNHEFSEGFFRDIAYLLECCSKGHTDRASVDFDINGTPLQIEFTFSIPMEEDEE